VFLIILQLLAGGGPRLLFELPFVIALCQAVDDGDYEVGHHGQHEFLEYRGEDVALGTTAQLPRSGP
jgi:hypothetical protein